MSKINLIIQKEYLTRVRSKSFLLITFLSPLLFAALIFVPIWLGQIKDSNITLIGVIDSTGLYANRLQNNEYYHFIPLQTSLAQEQAKGEESLEVLLEITNDLTQHPEGAKLYSSKQIGMELKGIVKNELERLAQEDKMNSFGVPGLEKMIQESRVSIPLATIKWGKDGSVNEGSSELAMVIAMVASMLIYIFILIYGQQVMSGVIEEKTNRIVEVLVSSVKPFDLMMGKIVGIALVGLTQFLLWGLLTLLLLMTTLSTIDLGATLTSSFNPPPGTVAPSEMAMNLQWLFGGGINLGELIAYFLFYFLGGYLLYASLFAAVGAAIDNQNDANQFITPLLIPMIFAVYAGIYASQNPEGPLAFWCSLIPFTSPVVMMARLPFDVPFWQIALSMLLLVFTFIGSTWVSAKIYRTGILMYGKKGSWRELWKWLRYRS